MLHQLHTFVDRRALWYALQKYQLICGQPQSCENFEVETGHFGRRLLRNLVVEPGSPAEDSHRQLCCEAVVERRELLIARRVQQLGRESILRFYCQENFECGNTSWGQRHEKWSAQALSGLRSITMDEIPPGNPLFHA